MGAAPGSICPRFFFIFFSTSGEVVLGALGAAPGSICPLSFFPFFSTSGGVLPNCPSFFPFFFHVRRSGTAPAARPGGRFLRTAR